MQWLRGNIEQIRLRSDSDVIIFNCVINLSGDKQQVLREAAWVQKPSRDGFTVALAAAGLTGITITETHRVHAAAASAIVRATKPDPTRRDGGAC